MENSELLLLKYQVDKVEFAFNENFDFTKDESIQLNQKFGRDFKKIDKDHCKVTIGLFIEQMEDIPMPFTLKVEVSGIFQLKDWENNSLDLMKTNTIAILYPFLRALVATLTSNANVPPYILPVFNVISWFEKNEKKEKMENQ